MSPITIAASVEKFESTDVCFSYPLLKRKPLFNTVRLNFEAFVNEVIGKINLEPMTFNNSEDYQKYLTKKESHIFLDIVGYINETDTRIIVYPYSSENEKHSIKLLEQLF